MSKQAEQVIYNWAQTQTVVARCGHGDLDAALAGIPCKRCRRKRR